MTEVKNKVGRPPGRKLVAAPLAIPPKVKQALQDEANQTKISFTALVREILKKHVKEKKLEQLTLNPAQKAG